MTLIVYYRQEETLPSMMLVDSVTIDGYRAVHRVYSIKNRYSLFIVINSPFVVNYPNPDA